MFNKNIPNCVDCDNPSARSILVVWTGFNNRVIGMCEQCASKYASREEAFVRLRRLAISADTRPHSQPDLPDASDRSVTLPRRAANGT
jgi:hypothetical protein